MPADTYVDRAEEFLVDLMREQYRVGAGLKDRLELAPIYERSGDLFAEPAVRERLAAMRANPQAKEARHLANFAVTSLAENAVKELTERIANAELKATVVWKEKEIPYHNVRPVLVREREMSRRHELSALELAVTVKQNPLRGERLRTQHELARGLGFVSYRGMIEGLRGWDLAALSKAMGSLLADTVDIYEDRLEKELAAARVARDQADTSDVAYVLRGPEFDDLFPADRLVPAFKGVMARLGLELESTPGLTLDTEPRPLKSPRAFCAPVRVPNEVFLVIKPIGGQDDYRALYHESGHAEHFAHIDPGLAFAFRYLGDEAVSETFAFLFESLPQNPRWLVDVLRVPVREAEKYQRFARFNKLWLLRRYAAKLQYELILHEDGPSGAETTYRDLLAEALHVKIRPERYLDDVDDGFYVAGYLRAWILEVQLRRYLVDRYGEGWYETTEAATLLRSMWSIGMRDSVEEIAQTRLGVQGLDVRPLIEELNDF